MHKSELMRKVNDIISIEDEFVERIASMDLTNVNHLHLRVTTFLKLKNGLTKLLDDSRRHKEIMENFLRIISGDPRDEY